ncbi:hypothetical protein B0H13DRAFT_1915168 [Mycena leptocephala]|nr:hypothetical protein B0H13DRAFT_1915168 [Mycena leptocephala]
MDTPHPEHEQELPELESCTRPSSSEPKLHVVEKSSATSAAGGSPSPSRFGVIHRDPDDSEDSYWFSVYCPEAAIDRLRLPIEYSASSLSSFALVGQNTYSTRDETLYSSLSKGVAESSPELHGNDAEQPQLLAQSALQLDRLACLRLAQRCANLLLSVVQENIYAISRLPRQPTFPQAIPQADETVREIAGCDSSLTDALSMFSLSVQMRILRQVKENKETEIENCTLLEAIAARQNNALGITVDQGQLTPRPGVTALPDEHAHADALPTLHTIQTIQSTQNTLDRAGAKQRSDVEMLRVPQVGRTEMPVLPGQPLPSAPPGYTARGAGRAPVRWRARRAASAVGACDAARQARPRVHRGRDRRAVVHEQGREMLPSWTITRYEVDRDVKIGIGFFSDVYKGTWHGCTVVIKWVLHGDHKMAHTCDFVLCAPYAVPLHLTCIGLDAGPKMSEERSGGKVLQYDADSYYQPLSVDLYRAKGKLT